MLSLSRRVLVGCAAFAAVLALGGCANTLRLKPLRDQDLFAASEAPYPVYWDGRAFEGMQLTFAAPQTGGSVLVTYGNCVIGGETTCVHALQIVTSHDNSFVPGSTHTGARRAVRGQLAVVTMGGDILEIATGTVVVDVMADTPALALAAAESMTPLNSPGEPLAPLAAPLPPNGFEQTAS